MKPRRFFSLLTRYVMPLTWLDVYSPSSRSYGAAVFQHDGLAGLARLDFTVSAKRDLDRAAA